MTAYQIQAIETRYGGTLFRSRLEARWAAFFDLVGWRWDYEPVDLKGWIPDFVIAGAKPIFVEVKPYLDPEEPLVAQTQREIESAYQGPNEVLLLGALIGWETCFLDGPAIGIIGEWYNQADGLEGCVPEYVAEHFEYCDPPVFWWQSAISQCGGRDFCAEYGSYTHRISGMWDAARHIVGTDLAQLQLLWRDAGNRVQWRGR